MKKEQKKPGIVKDEHNEKRNKEKATKKKMVNSEKIAKKKYKNEKVTG